MHKQVISVSNINQSIPFLLTRGVYLFELYGASGGGSLAGKGGFASGILTVQTVLQVYLYPGGAGAYYTPGGCYEGGWNGGGKVCTNSYASTGGGASDVRLKEGDPSTRIIVAGGGGGSGDGGTEYKYGYRYGGSGGGENGETVTGYSSHYPKETFYAYGGTQEGPGSATIRFWGTNYVNTAGKGENGGDGAGGENYGGGGGGGYFGGGGGFDVTGGGGGSSYISSIFLSGKTISGNITNHIGDGNITIYLLRLLDCDCRSSLQFSRMFLFVMFFFTRIIKVSEYFKLCYKALINHLRLICHFFALTINRAIKEFS